MEEEKDSNGLSALTRSDWMSIIVILTNLKERFALIRVIGADGMPAKDKDGREIIEDDNRINKLTLLEENAIGHAIVVISDYMESEEIFTSLEDGEEGETDEAAPIKVPESAEIRKGAPAGYV